MAQRDNDGNWGRVVVPAQDEVMSSLEQFAGGLEDSLTSCGCFIGNGNDDGDGCGCFMGNSNGRKPKEKEKEITVQ